MPVSCLRWRILAVAVVSLCTLSGCSVLPGFGGFKKPVEKIYFIDPELPAPTNVTGTCGDLLVGEMNGAPGFRSARMAYTTKPLKIDYYAYSRWADSFGRLLGGPLRRGLQNSGHFAHVIAAPTIVSTDLRLEFTDLRLIQSFSSPDAESSTVSISVQARLLNSQPLNLIASRHFEFQASAAPNPEGSAVAANELAVRLIAEISDFSATACASRLSP